METPLFDLMHKAIQSQLWAFGVDFWLPVLSSAADLDRVRVRLLITLIGLIHHQPHPAPSPSPIQEGNFLDALGFIIRFDDKISRREFKCFFPKLSISLFHITIPTHIPYMEYQRCDIFYRRQLPRCLFTLEYTFRFGICGNTRQLFTSRNKKPCGFSRCRAIAGPQRRGIMRNGFLTLKRVKMALSEGKNLYKLFGFFIVDLHSDPPNPRGIFQIPDRAEGISRR